MTNVGTGLASLSTANTRRITDANSITVLGYQMKTCTKCGKTKPKIEFNKQSGRLDGLRSNCKECVNASISIWKANNKDRVKAVGQAYYLANTEKCRAATAAWNAANPGKQNAASLAWNKANPERYKAAISASKKANPERYRVYRQNRRARQSGSRLSPIISAKLFKLQRGKCACCGLPLGDDYHLDHIMPLARGGSNTDDNIQLLRSICNLQKNAKHPVDFMQSRGFLL